MTRAKGFHKEEEIRLEDGAVIVPIRKNGSQQADTEKMIDYLMNSRWSECKFAERCLEEIVKFDRVIRYDGFSCERCPLRDREENVLQMTPEVLNEYAIGCSALIAEAFGQSI